MRCCRRLLEPETADLWGQSGLARGYGGVAGADRDIIVFDDAGAGAGAGAVDAGLEVRLGGLDRLAVDPRLAVSETLLNAVEPDFDETRVRVLREIDAVDEVIPAVVLQLVAVPEGGRSVAGAEGEEVLRVEEYGQSGRAAPVLLVKLLDDLP